MGNCVGNSSKAEDKPTNKEQEIDTAVITQQSNEEKLLVKLLVEVNTLSSDHGPLRWQPLFHSLIPVSLHCIQEGSVYVYRVSGSGVTGTSFSVDIKVPGTKMRKTSKCFIQWKDDENDGAWGLNFMSETDAIQFLNGCSPPTLTPMSERLRHTFSTLSLALPIPEPPTNTNTNQLLSTATETVSPQSEPESQTLEESVENSNDDVSVFSYSSREEEDDSDLPELFQPSSPFQGGQAFILPDIMEENDEEIVSENEQLDTQNLDEGFEAAGLDIANDIAETNFTDDVAERASNDGNTSTPDEIIPGPFEAPTLPNSPPPGPLLSPRLSMLLAEGKLTDHDTSRFSTVSLADDVPPPPLPSSLPPGKLISPRSSLYHDRSSFIIEEHQSSLGLMSSRIESLKEEREESEEDTQQKKILVDNVQADRIDPVLVLAPPIALEETDYLATKRRQSIYFDPPLQFQAGSDSGFPDTDVQAVHSDQSTNGGNIVIFDTVEAYSKNGGLLKGMKQFEGPHHKGSSTTTTSYTEEMLTEYSESVDMKTNVSSTSQHSLSEAEETTIIVKKSGTLVGQGGKEVQATVSLEQEALKPAIRKTGWVELKQMLICKNKKVAMSAKRKWKNYWATLKGTSLLLYQCDEQSTLSENARVDLRIDVELCLAHAVHDHVKRDHIFCLSTSNGKSYYIQTTNQSEVEDWITVIHCSAATALTSQPHKVEAVKYLKNQVIELNKMIEKETQLRNMTELNMNAPLTESTGRTMAAEQVVACSENIEKYNVELYRIRCYIASMEGTELPNPQSLLGSISKPTKLALGRVGTFSVSSLHAMVSARHNVGPSASSGSLFSVTKFSLFSNLPKTGRNSKEKAATLPRTPERPRKLRSLEISYPLPKLPSNVAVHSNMNGQSKTSKRRLEISHPYPKISRSSSGSTLDTSPREPTAFSPFSDTTLDDPFHVEAGMPLWPFPFLNEAVIQLPSGETTHLTLRNDMTVMDVLTTVCEKHQLDVADHFVKLTVKNRDTDFIDVIPKDSTPFVDLTYQNVEICQKSLRTVNLSKTDNDSKNFGLSLTPQWNEDRTDIKKVVVAAVCEGSVADDGGIAAGDEIILVNESSVVELGWDAVEEIITSAASVSMTLRYMAQNSTSYSLSHHILEGLICPAPSSRQRELSGEALQNLIVPKPNGDDEASIENSSFHGLSQNQIDLLLKDSKELSKLIRGWERRGSMDESTAPWTKEDKLRKSARDLVETEADYVMLLTKLVERYLDPMKSESFLSQGDVSSLTGNIIKIVDLQKAFLKCLQDSLTLELDKTKTPEGESPLKHVAHGIAGAFLSHADHFREYSTFCASHQKLKSILSTGRNEQLYEFFEVRNPNFETSLSLEQLLIKPIVRISRYPLFLDAMMKYTEPERVERSHLKDALECMEGVASYINDSQRLCETYYLIFEEMMTESGYSEVGVSVHISQLKYHGEVLWLNPTDEQLARGWKKGQGPATLCFVFKSAIILLCLDKKTKRKENKGPRELLVTADDIRYKLLLPVVYCGVQDLPDSDGVTNMWQVQCRRKHDHGFKRYLFRSQNIEQKSTMVHLIQQSTLEQQRIYGGSPSIYSRSRASSTPTFSATGRSSPASLISFSHSPYRLRVTSRSPTPSQLSLPALSVTTDTDQD